MKKVDPWAFGIVAFLVGFATLVVIAGTLISRQHYQLVRQDYYTHEIAYEDFLNAIRRVDAMSEKPVLEILPSDKRISIQMPTNLLNDIRDVKLHLYYPADQDQDQHHLISFTKTGLYLHPYPPGANGNWKVELQWTLNDDVHIFGKRVFL